MSLYPQRDAHALAERLLTQIPGNIKIEFWSLPLLEAIVARQEQIILSIGELSMPNLLAELNERVIAMEKDLEKRAPSKDSKVYAELEDKIASLNVALTEVKDQLKTVEDVHTALTERIAALEKTENSDGK